jgi:hypothetical protein
MAEFGSQQARRGLDQPCRSRYTPEQIANALVPRRDRLVDQVPVELAAARGLTRDQWELAVDEAIEYVATRYAKPIESPESVERVFWKATSLRIKQLRDGRQGTVRGGWRQVTLEDADLPTLEADPERVAIQRSEQGLLLEFSATLTEGERRVLVCQYGGGGARKRGWRVMARELDMEVGEVRTHERNIARKLQRFSAILAAGTLCANREPQLVALVSGQLNEETERIALLHLLHCPACRAEHAARLRAIRSGDLQREIAQLLPGPIVVEGDRHPRFIDLLPDWMSRPLTHEAASTSSQIGIAGRGIGTIAATKLAALCIGGVSVVGGGLYCISSPLVQGHPDPEPTPAPRIAETHQKPTKAEPPDLGDGKVLAAQARSKPTPTPTPKPRPKPETKHESATPTSHEQESAVSPAPAGSLPNGESEFELTNPRSASAPAPPVSGGGPEFP